MPNAPSKPASPKHTPFDKEPVAPPSRPSPFYLRTLGEASLRRAFDSDASETLLDAGKPLALIAFVASSPGRAARREQLLDLLWADMEPEKGKHALRQTLWYIKKKVGESLLATQQDAISLATALPGDRDDFLAAAEAGDHAAVVALHRGDFFPDFAAPGGAEFEKWADLERRRLRAFFLRSAEAHARELLSLGRSREAIALARRARDFDPEVQAGWRLVLEILTAARDTTGVELEAVALEQRALSDEMELEPATRALIRVARRGAEPNESAGASPGSFVSDIVGREREFSLLLARWDDVKHGAGRHLHLRAPAGIGKTRLINDLKARLRSRRGRVASVRCDMGSRELPFAAASEIAASLCKLPGARGVSPSSAAALVALNPSLSSYFSPAPDTASGEEALRRRAVAVGELAAAVSEEQPVAILVDDVHWMDGASRIVLSQLAARCASLPVLLVTTGRPTPEGRLDSSESETLDLPALTEGQCAALLSAVAELPNDPWAASLAANLWHASSGSPLHAIETLQLLMERGVLTHDANVWRCTDTEALEQTLRAGGALGRRLAALSRPERWIVTFLAVDGTPLTQVSLTHASALTADTVAEALKALEQRGLVTAHDNQWSLSHDEISAALLEQTSRDATQAAHAALGLRLWQEGPTELRALRRAAGHLVQGDDLDALDALFNRFVRFMRGLGDTRPLHTLADDLLGRHASADLARRLVRALPLSVRAGLSTSRRAAALVAATVAIPMLLLSFVLIRSSVLRAPAPVAELMVLAPRANGLAITRVPLLAGDWVPGRELVIARMSGEEVGHAELTRPVLERPGHRGSWLYSRSTGDSGVIDLFEDSRGQSRRITWSPRDDHLGDVSPDGRLAAIETARWREDSHYDIATVNLSTGAYIQVTRGDESDASPRWSHDGSRIAFTRRSWQVASHQVCSVAPDGTDLSCLDSFLDVGHVAGWFDERHLVITREVGVTYALFVVDLESGVATPLNETTRGSATLSPDGRWMACACDRLGYAKGSWFVMPVGRSAEARPVRLPPGDPVVQIAWADVGRARAIDRLEIEGGRSRPVVGLPYALSAFGYAGDRRTDALSRVRWHSLDPDILEVDSASGAARPLKAGIARVEAQIPGWRQASRSLDVTARLRTVPELETWSIGWDTRWFTFGQPTPVIDTLPDRRALRNNGDDSFSSGVLGLAPIDPLQGVALEGEISIHLTQPQWQTVNIGLTPFIDTSTITPEARLIGIPSRSAEQTKFCRVGIPAGEGWQYATLASASLGEESQNQTLPPRAKTGGWVRVRVQILPDGRCGAAIDGKPFFLSRSRFPMERQVQAQIWGSSVETKALVGPVRIWRGVPDDIDWAAFARVQRGTGRAPR